VRSRNNAYTLIVMFTSFFAVSVFYYYSFKSTALTMADPRFKEKHLDWIADQLADK